MSTAANNPPVFVSLAPREIPPPDFDYGPFIAAVEGLKAYRGVKGPGPPMQELLADFQGTVGLLPPLFPPDPVYEAFLRWAGQQKYIGLPLVNLITCLYSGTTRKGATRALLELRQAAFAARDAVIKAVGTGLLAIPQPPALLTPFLSAWYQPFGP